MEEVIKSKNQIKREKRLEVRESRKGEFKKILKLKDKQKRQERNLINEQRISQGLEPQFTKRPRYKADPIDIKICIDLDFQDKMNQKELKSMAKQIQECYATNNHTPFPFQMIVTSFNGKVSEILNSKIPNLVWRNCSFHEDSFLNIIESSNHQNLVYLTADSPNVVDELVLGKTYILGGIVDHNRYKNLCLEKAEQHGISHARLPIGEYIKLFTRKVLTVNQVYLILSKMIETKDWKTAFLESIPSRKFNSNVLQTQPGENDDQISNTDDKIEKKEKKEMNKL